MRNYYRRYNHAVRNTLYMFNRALRTARYRSHRGSIYDQVPTVYYRSPHLHRFYVIDRPGIYIYNPRTGRRIRHLRRGAILTHTHFIYRRYRGAWITRIIGYYGRHRCEFTSRKNCVHW